jgi:Protein of unknown function (DUF2845)
MSHAPNRYRWQALGLLLGAALLVPEEAWAFRCGNRLVHEGDGMGSVIAKCGEPTEVSRQVIVRPQVFWRHGRPYPFLGGDLQVPVEIWTYNLGPNKLMRRLRIEDGLVIQITTLGYGYL